MRLNWDQRDIFQLLTFALTAVLVVATLVVFRLRRWSLARRDGAAEASRRPNRAIPVAALVVAAGYSAFLAWQGWQVGVFDGRAPELLCPIGDPGPGAELVSSSTSKGMTHGVAMLLVVLVAVVVAMLVGMGPLSRRDPDARTRADGATLEGALLGVFVLLLGLGLVGADALYGAVEVTQVVRQYGEQVTHGVVCEGDPTLLRLRMLYAIGVVAGTIGCLATVLGVLPVERRDGVPV